MAHTQHTPTLASLEEAIIVLFCLVDDAYTLLNLLNPKCQSHESLKRLSDSEVLTLSTSTGSSGDHKGASRNCGHDISATLI